MNINSFSKEIDPKINSRGLKYFQSDAVRDLEQITSTKWSACVEGSETYSVDVIINKNKIIDWSCDCPYDWGPMCKHVAAVLYAIQKQSETAPAKVKTSGKAKKKKKTKEEQVKDILEKTDFAQLKNFVQEHVLDDRKCMNRFLFFFAEEIDEDSDTKYNKRLKSIVRSGMDRDGFINYRNSYEVTGPIFDLLEKAKTFRMDGDNNECVSICKAIIEEVSVMLGQMDDSSGDAGCIFDEACEIVRNVGPVLLPKAKDRLFDFLYKEYAKEKYTDFGFDSQLLDILVTISDSPKKNKSCLLLLDSQISIALKNESSGDWRIVGLLKEKIDLLEHQGFKKEARLIIEGNIQYSEFRQIIVDEKIKKKDYASAKKLVEEGLALDKSKAWHDVIRDWHEYMLKIAQKEKSKADIRKWSETLFDSSRHDMKYYRVLKKTFSEGEWGGYVDNIINNLINDVTAIANIYVEEKRFERLLNLLEVNSKHLHFTEKYAHHFLKKNPDVVLKIYKEGINILAQSVGRRNYKGLAGYLKEIQKIKGGKEVVSGMVKEYREHYKNRPAMLEILRRGF